MKKRVICGTAAAATVIGVLLWRWWRMYIPELNLAIEERSTDEQNHEQKVKRYICELQDVRYILYEPFKSAEDAAAIIRTILKEHHVHIKTAAADDIALCREKYNLLKRRKLR